MKEWKVVATFLVCRESYKSKVIKASTPAFSILKDVYHLVRKEVLQPEDKDISEEKDISPITASSQTL